MSKNNKVIIVFLYDEILLSHYKQCKGVYTLSAQLCKNKSTRMKETGRINKTILKVLNCELDCKYYDLKVIE